MQYLIITSNSNLTKCSHYFSVRWRVFPVIFSKLIKNTFILKGYVLRDVHKINSLKCCAWALIELLFLLFQHKSSSVICFSGPSQGEINCCVCQGEASDPPNEIVLCDNCGMGKLHLVWIFSEIFHLFLICVFLGLHFQISWSHICQVK